MADRHRFILSKPPKLYRRPGCACLRSLRETALSEARAAFEEAEREGETAVEETFHYLYADMPDLLALQMQRRME